MNGNKQKENGRLKPRSAARLFGGEFNLSICFLIMHMDFYFSILMTIMFGESLPSAIQAQKQISEINGHKTNDHISKP